MSASKFEENMKKKQDAREVLMPVNIISEHKDVSLNSNNDDKKNYELVKGENATIHDVRESIMNRYQERINKPKVSDNFERYTFLLSNSNRSRLEKLARHKKRGFKTHFINDAIEAMLDAFEQNK